MTLRVLDWNKSKDGIRATLGIENGTGSIIRDKVLLGSALSRKKFIEKCPNENPTDMDPVLMSLDDLLRAKWSKSQNPDIPTEAPPPSLSVEEEQEALHLLQNPRILEELLDAADRLGFAGDENNKVLLFLAYTSRLIDSPLNVTIKGESSSGKSHEMEVMSEFMPPESVIKLSGASAKALFYTARSLKHKLMLIAERPGAEDSDYSIRTMQSEKKIVFWVPQKGDNGRIKTEEITVEGPACFVETTTKTHLHPENETRTFDIYVDESEQHTIKVFEAQDRRFTNPIHPEIRTRTLKRWQNAQRLLKPYPVLIEFARQIPFPTKPLRVRRDRPKFMALIEASALLHQYQRTTKSINDTTYLVATIEDYAIARELALPILKNVLKGTTPKCVELVEEARKLSDDQLEITKKSLEDTLKWDRKTVSKYLKEALARGCLEVSDVGGKGRGNSAKYDFIQPVSDVDVPLPSPDDFKALLNDVTSLGAP
ncbi:hypothetical protein BVX98_04565 [bacterium F11]|nr:hypothetical protein BVX98_04565 [bacterium F11]